MDNACRICRRPAVNGTPVCAACLDAGAWIQITHGAEERKPGQFWAVTSISVGQKRRCFTAGPHGRERASEIAAAEARREADCYSGDWLIEITAGLPVAA